MVTSIGSSTGVRLANVATNDTPAAPKASPTTTTGDGFTRVSDADADRKLKTFTSGRVTNAATEGTQPSKWWPTPGKEMDVDIDGYDFDFNPKKGTNGGDVDGPFSHDGKFSVLENAGDKFRMKVNVGSDSAAKGDIDVDIRVTGGKATITGSVQGKALPADGVTGNVTGQGTSQDPFRLDFKDPSGGKHSITWRPE